MLKLYGLDFSTRSNKVKMCANVIGVPFEFIEVDFMKGEHKKPEFLKWHPGGKIPVIDDEGFILFESVAIIKYLCRKHGSDLYPQELKAQALVDQWCDFASQHLDVQFVRVAYNAIIAPQLGKPASEKSIQLGIKMAHELFPVFDAQLAKSNYLAGEKFSIADINLFAIIEPAEQLKIDLNAYPALLAWRKKIASKCTV